MPGRELRTYRWLAPLRPRHACSRTCFGRAIASRAASTDNNHDPKTKPLWLGSTKQRPLPTMISPPEAVAKAGSIRHAAFGDWSPSARMVHERIVSGQVDAASHLESSIASNAASMETVRVCLDAEMTRILKHPRAARPAVFRRENKQFARKMLLHLWSHPNMWLPLLIKDDRARVQLCYLVIAEKAEGFLEKWLTARIPEEATAWTLEDSIQDSSPPDVAWRTRLLRAITVAHLMHDANKSADTAIKSYWRLDRVVAEAKRRFHEEQSSEPDKPWPGIVSVSMAPALSALRAELITGDRRRTDPELWDLAVRRIRQILNSSAPRSIATQFGRAALSLHHPTEPEATDALAFLQMHFLEASDSVVKESRKLIPATDQVFRVFVTKASKMAREDGQERVAACIEALMAKLLPPVIGKTRSGGRTSK
ncbi:hypothetical protein BST61_g2666 [Cercospora zeina]